MYEEKIKKESWQVEGNRFQSAHAGNHGAKQHRLLVYIKSMLEPAKNITIITIN